MDKRIEAIGEQIVQGDLIAARRGLKALLQGKIPLALRSKVATLARRVDLPQVGVKLLNPIVRPTGSHKSKATAAEICEYSACLTFIGGSAEAVQLLKGVSPKEVPESLLFRSFAYFSEWEYGQAIPLLKEYVQATGITDYARAIGKVNLLAALVYERQFAEAETLQAELREECVRREYQRLLGNCYELAAYIHVGERNVSEAKKTLAQARELAKTNMAMDSFYISKWEVILDFMIKPHLESNLSALHAVRAEAQKRSLWETVRQCDGYEATFKKNEKLLWQVYFGTPYPRFREQLLEDFGKVTLPGEYCLELSKGTHSQTLDLATGTLLGGKIKQERMKAGQICHRLLNILFTDLYRPLRVAVAHHALFPEEFYNPSSSPHRVHEGMRRLRAELSQRRIPLVITEKDGYYRLNATKPLTVRLTTSEKSGGPELAEFSMLKQKWARKEFTVQECLEFLGVSKRTAVRTLNRLVESGLVTREGQSSATRYRLKG